MCRNIYCWGPGGRKNANDDDDEDDEVRFSEYKRENGNVINF